MQEEILLKRSRIGTIIHYFNTDINENNYSTYAIPAIVKLSPIQNNPIEINTFDGVFLSGDSSTVLWKRNTQSMNYEIDTYWPNSNYVSGRTFSQIYEYSMSEINTTVIKNRFIDSMNQQFTAGTITYVFFEETTLDDFYANIKLEKTFDILDTLNIYNRTSGIYPFRESATGVVFGKIEAIQKILDDEGNQIRIPLKNVPIGIFVASTEFESSNDEDENGNRIRLNYRSPSLTEDNYSINSISNYFNIESASFDNKFLKQAPFDADGISLHPTFSNVVYTNENGEFILHNIEVGPQILFFEVDLLKQGLTKDEVALNFFPYPSNYENISIDTVPHYFYRAIPIDVVPTWGQSFQTGYTEVDVSINLDLRKWTTYIIPPASYKNLPIDDIEYHKISKAPLSVKVRDMSKFEIKKAKSAVLEDRLEAYPSEQIQMVEIQNILEKSPEQQWEWDQEFSQLKSKATFKTYGYHAIKLPANIYDKAGIKTDLYGIPLTENSSSKGVWLSAYQLKVFLTTEETFYRTTGLSLSSIPGAPGFYDRDHFHCCLNDEINTYLPIKGTGFQHKGEGIGKFPYEKAWSSVYPEKYSIPKYPTHPIYPNSGPPYKEVPIYSDGDVIMGNSWAEKNGAGGFGLSFVPDDNSSTTQYTDFATNVTMQNMYRYEYLESKNQYYGCYAGGYFSGLENIPGFEGFPHSEVIDGEKYQRLEAGYGYFLFPSSLPKVSMYKSYFQGLNIGQIKKYREPYVSFEVLNSIASGDYWGENKLNHYQSFSAINNGKSIAIDFSKKSNSNVSDYVVNDKLNIYRILDGRNRLSLYAVQAIIGSYSIINWGGTENRLYSLVIINSGEADVIMTNSFRHQILVENLNGTSAYVPRNSTFTLKIGSKIVINPYNQIENSDYAYAREIVEYSSLTLPGNGEYSETDNMYKKCLYTFKAGIYGDIDFSGNYFENAGLIEPGVSLAYWTHNTNFVANVEADAKNFYIQSTFTTGDGDELEVDGNNCNGIRYGFTSSGMMGSNNDDIIERGYYAIEIVETKPACT